VVSSCKRMTARRTLDWRLQHRFGMSDRKEAFVCSADRQMKNYNPFR
jgi:hypothetical protein